MHAHDTYSQLVHPGLLFKSLLGFNISSYSSGRCLCIINSYIYDLYPHVHPGLLLCKPFSGVFRFHSILPVGFVIHQFSSELDKILNLSFLYYFCGYSPSKDLIIRVFDG